MRQRFLAILMLALVLVGGSMPNTATSAAQAGTPSPFVETEAGRNDAPIPVVLPRDDAPHDVGIEWWYYTGHLFTDSGDRYGFEYVIFKGHRGDVLGYAAHFAITDNAIGRFSYDQRLGLVPETPPSASGFDLRVGDWQMRGAGGNDHLVASMAEYGIDLTVQTTKQPALHDGDGYYDYGTGEGSYYYSRTRMAISGTLTVDGRPLKVIGEAWFDHQWGNFSTYKEGWDWYAIQLDNDTELMIYIIHAPAGGPLIVDGSFIAADGSLTVLDRGDFTVTATGSWTSPHSGAIYPSGWRIEYPAEQLTLELTPSLPDQELDTTASTDVIYWEGEVAAFGTHAGRPVAGLGYVELTGYAGTDRKATPPKP
ncbi:MAG TPA: lipocalin family protein [Thermomicrobiales bacterium]|jgi:predicted secreted hydrolase|nr:lipocalin family protein [Thermomicrobiales bacterium]